MNGEVESSFGLPRVEDVGRLAGRGVAFSGLRALGTHAILLAGTTILARHLTADDYGLIGMATCLTAFFAYFSDFGLSWVTVQAKDLTREQVNALWWVNSAMGVLLFALTALLAPLVATFFSRPDLYWPCVAMATQFVFAGMAVQPAALLRREMRFGRLSGMEVLAQAVASVVGVGLAVHGAGLWALVSQKVLRDIVRTVGFHAAAGFLPRIPPRQSVAGLGSLLWAGCSLAAAGVFSYLAQNLDNVLIGYSLGAEALGYYSRAYFLMSLPFIIVGQVVGQATIPALSALRGRGEEFGLLYRTWLERVAFIGFPMTVGLALVAREAVTVIYGPRWVPVVPILEWLSLAGFVQLSLGTCGWLFISTGRNRQQLLWAAFSALALGITFACVVSSGAVFVAAGYAAVSILVLAPVGFLASHRSVGLPLMGSLRAVAPSVLAVAAMGVVVAGVGRLLVGPHVVAPLGLVCKAAAGVASYAVAALLFMRPLPFEGLESWAVKWWRR